MKIKQRIRRIVVRLYSITSLWVIPHDVWLAIDDEDPRAREMIKECRRAYPDDPEIQYAEGLARFLFD